MSNLHQDIADYEAQKARRVAPEVLQVMEEANQALHDARIDAGSLRTGDRVPDFALPNHLGETRRLGALLDESVVVLSFYRGGWCPYCNLELAALQRALPEIRAAGAALVAVSPETPDHATDTQTRHALDFEVLSDVGGAVCEAFGLRFELPERLRPIYARIGIDVPAYNGDTTFTLPIPATYVIDRDGVIRFDFVDIDYRRRLEPDELLRALRAQ